MEIYLIRHGETYPTMKETYDIEKRTSNPELTPRGIKQAEALARRCKNIYFDRIIASDLNRAIMTANILGKTAGVCVELDKNFREIDMGDLHCTTWKSFPEYYDEWSKHETDMPYPNGECGKNVWERCKKSLEAITREDVERVAIVCHGGTIRCILSGLLDMPQQKRMMFGNPIMNCSISVIVINNNKVSLHTVNEYSHIEDM